MKNQQTIPLRSLAGQWYIHLTNFPMWLKGDRIMPTFNYTISKKNGIEGLEDHVQFIKNGREKSIKGFDTPLNEHNTAFEWRGKGWMKVLKSRWTILYFTERWAVIYFDKTLFTPKGYDVIARNEVLSPLELDDIYQKLADLNITEKLSLIRK